MPSASNQVTAVDYNTIRDKVVSILGTGSSTRGYGQTVQSTAVSQGNTITKAQWDALRYDIINIRLHQDGILPTIVTVSSTDPIRYGAGHPNTNFNTLIDQAIINRFNLGGSQQVISTKGTKTYTSSWGTEASAEITLTFANATKYVATNLLKQRTVDNSDATSDIVLSGATAGYSVSAVSPTSTTIASGASQTVTYTITATKVLQMGLLELFGLN